MKKTFIILLIISIIGVLIYLVNENFSFTSSVKKDIVKSEKIVPKQKFQNGDIIFQTSTSAQSKAIQIATKSKYSHMGIIYKIKNEFFVYEAVQPVKLTPLKEWINRGENKHYVIKRLKNADKILTQEVLVKMKKAGEKYKGKNYDLYFEWSDDKIYCSELVWKIYKEATGLEIGKLEKLSSFNLTDKIVQQEIKERYGNKVPMNETVISPVAMFNSDKLIEMN